MPKVAYALFGISQKCQILNAKNAKSAERQMPKAPNAKSAKRQKWPKPQALNAKSGIRTFSKSQKLRREREFFSQHLENREKKEN